jgi:hypothetical protein
MLANHERSDIPHPSIAVWWRRSTAALAARPTVWLVLGNLHGNAVWSVTLLIRAMTPHIAMWSMP